MAEPLCPYFNKCGGCSAQHIDYSVQVENKKKALAQAINFDIDTLKVFTGEPYHYRNRMDLVFFQDGLGFRKKGSWNLIVDIDQCAISNSELNTLLKEIRDYFTNVDHFDLKTQTGTFRYAVIRTPRGDSSISFVLNSDSSRINEAVEKIKEFSKTTSANNIIVAYNPQKADMSISADFFVVKGKDTLEETYMDRKFHYSIQGFFQNNSVMAEKMHEYVHSLLKSHSPEESHLLDLYGGVGTFGINNASLFKSMTTVESVPQCTDAAIENIKLNNINNAKAITMDAKQLKKLSLQTPLFVINDPPRSGMNPKTIAQLNELQPEVIIYISCNIKQLSKELPKFKNYNIKSAALFDLFPQTPHSEAIIEFVRK